jgi:hypothetical protein
MRTIKYIFPAYMKGIKIKSSLYKEELYQIDFPIETPRI